MPVFHPWRLGMHRRIQGLFQGRVHQHRLRQGGLEHFPGHRSGPQEHRAVSADIHNGGFHADACRTAVHNGVDLSGQVCFHMICPGGTWPSGGIGAGGSHRHAGKGDEPPGYRVLRHADRHGVQAACGLIRDLLCLFHDHGQGPRPEGLRQKAGPVRNLLYDGAELLQL